MQITSPPNYHITSNDKILDLSYPHVMGILNVTPDSFSDGGQFNNCEHAVAHAQKMIAEGATILDVGGESTRPHADTVAVEEELARVIPVIKALRNKLGKAPWISIDTSNPEVMRQAVAAGADIVNDVRALKRAGAAMVVAELGVPVVLMHMRGEPSTMNDLTYYDDVMSEIYNELQQRIDVAINAGITPQNIIIDAGFGFAKQYQHHKVMLNKFHTLHKLGFPVMFGISRKRFLGEVLTEANVPAFTDYSVKDRDALGMATALLAVQQGACIIRTHNVAITMQAVSLWQQLNADNHQS